MNVNFSFFISVNRAEQEQEVCECVFVYVFEDLSARLGRDIHTSWDKLFLQLMISQSINRLTDK